MSVANYHRMYLESLHDIKSANVVIYADTTNYRNINEVINKLTLNLRQKYKNVFLYTNLNLEIEGVSIYKVSPPVRDMLSNVLYRENSKFIGFMKTNTILYEEVISYLKCANVEYRIYDTISNKWVIGKGNNKYV